MEVFLEFSGGNRRLSEGTNFLYQIFPSNLSMYVQQLINAAKTGRVKSVKTLLSFFLPTWPKFINEKDQKTGDTALHVAAQAGESEVVEILLENYADINVVNERLETPMFQAMQVFKRTAAQLLTEWGCDLSQANLKGDSPLSICKNETLVHHVTDWNHYCEYCIDKIANESDVNALMSVIRKHKTGEQAFISLRSRVIAGSTLLHAAAYLNSYEAVRELLDMGVDPNVTDFKGATPLHCTTDFTIAKALLLAGARANAVDRQGNTPLHLRAFGGIIVKQRSIFQKHSEATGEATHDKEAYKVKMLEPVEEGLDTKLFYLLQDFSADPIIRNKKKLMPIHCAAIKGRREVIKFFLESSFDNDNRQANELGKDDIDLPSLTYLALAYGHVSCATW